MLTILRQPPRRMMMVSAGLALGAWALIVAGLYGYERAWLRANQDGVIINARPYEPLYRFEVEGILRPPTVPAGAATLVPDERVIGIEVDGKSRAYRLSAFQDRARHIVNDMIGSVPVTVTYCNISDCVRAYTDVRSIEPLDVSVAGLFEGREMVLKVGGRLFLQDSGARLEPGSGPATLPLERVSLTRTTWEKWKQGHPETDLYAGVL